MGNPAMGAKIKALRVRAGLSQEQLGRLVDVTVGQVGRWERNVDQPSVKSLRALVRILKCSYDDILD